MALLPVAATVDPRLAGPIGLLAELHAVGLGHPRLQPTPDVVQLTLAGPP